MSQEQTLEPCPHCGKSHTLKIVLASEHWADEYDGYYPHSESYAVMCDASSPNGQGGCGASGGFQATEADAIAVWNRRAALSATQPAQAAQPVQVVPPELDVRRIMLDIVPGDGDGLEVYAKNVDDVVTKLTKMGERIENLEGAHTAAVAQGAGEVVAWSDDDDNELLHVIGMLERVQVGETVTASDRLYDSSVRPRRMTIKDAQSLVGPCVNILRKLHKKLCAQPAAGADVLLAIATVRESYRGTDWGKVAECICDAIDAAIAASGRQE